MEVDFKSAVKSLFTTLMGAVGGFFVAKGFLDQFTLTEVIGSLSTAVAALADFFFTKKTQ